MESTVLHVLKWDLSAITPNDFVAHIVHRLPLDPASVPNVKKHAQTFIALCAAGKKSFHNTFLLGFSYPSRGKFGTTPRTFDSRFEG